MKIGTDSTLLGAWAEIENARMILDIGTGTGVLSLMSAQRNSKAEIYAIEIDFSAFEQAKDNFRNSPWRERLSIVHSPVQAYSSECCFDAIISNPPFYQHDKHLIPSEQQRRTARATTSLGFYELCGSAARLLTDQGVFSLILPIEQEADFFKAAELSGLYCCRRCLVFPRENKAANRLLLSFSKVKKHLENSHLIIRKTAKEVHDYHSDYSTLLKDFLIIF